MKTFNSVRLEEIEFVLNKNKGNPYHGPDGRFTFGPGGGKTEFSNPTTFYSKDDVRLEKDGKVYEGTLEYDKEAQKWYVLTKDGEKSNFLSKQDFREMKQIKSSKQKKLEELAARGIVHKAPKERQTQNQKEQITKLDNKGLLYSDEKDWLLKYGDENVLSTINKVVDDAEALGVDLSSIKLGRKRTGSETWGTASYNSRKEYGLNLVGQIYDGNPLKIDEIENVKKGYHTANSVEATVRHEMGHIVSYQNALIYLTIGDYYSVESKIEEYCFDIQDKAINKLYGSLEYSDGRKMLLSEMSEYGLKNPKEFLAESWANPDFSDLTRETYNLMKEDLKRNSTFAGSGETHVIKLNSTDYWEIEICSGYGPKIETVGDVEIILEQ